MPLSCNQLSKNIPPFYLKVIYNKVTESTDINGISSKYDSLNDALLRPDIDSKIITDDIVNLVKRPDGIEQIKFIFLGNYDDKIKNILDKIEVSKSYDNSVMDKLTTEFGYDSKESLIKDWNILETDTVKFIPFYLARHDKLAWVYNILSIYLNSDTDIFLKEGIYMFIEKETVNVDICVNQLHKEFLNRKIDYSHEAIHNKLSQFNINTSIISSMIKKHNNKFENIIHDPIIVDSIRLYKNLEVISHSFTENYHNVPINSLLTNYFRSDMSYDEEIDVSKPTVYLQLHDSNLLSYFLKDSKQTVYIYNFQNLVKHIPKLQENDDDTNRRIVRKLFPLMTPELINSPLLGIGFIDDVVMKEHKSSISEKKEKLVNYSNLRQSYNKYINYLNSGSQIFNDSFNFDLTLENEYVISITRQLNLPDNYDFKNIFNNLKLDYDLPFVKFKDSYGSNEIVYKFFKPIAAPKTYKYEPMITKNTLDSWIRFKGYELDNDSVIPLKILVKNISYKIKIGIVKDDKIISGKIFNMYSEDGKQYFDILDSTVTDQIIPGVPIECIADKPEKLHNGTEVSFYRPIYVYGDIEIDKTGLLRLSANISDFDTCVFNRDVDSSNLNFLQEISSKLNTFIKKMFLVEDLVKYSQINDNFTEQLSNDLETKNSQNLFRLENLSYKYSMRIPSKDIIVNHEFLYKTADMLHPFVVINEKPYNIGEKIRFFDAENKYWIKGVIKEFNEDNTYTIELFDEDLNETTNRRVEEVSPIFIDRMQHESRIFELIYKRVNNFDLTSSSINLIKKLINIGYNSTDIILKLIDQYNVDKDYAIKMVKQVNKTTEFMSSEKMTDSTGISIKINYEPRLHSSDETGIDIIVENVKSQDDLTSIQLFLQYYFTLYVRLILGSLITDNAREQLFDILFKKDIDVGELKSEAQNIDKMNESPKKPSIHGSMDVGFLSSDDEDDDDWSDDEDDDEDDDDDMGDTPINDDAGKKSLVTDIEEVTSEQLKLEQTIDREQLKHSDKILENLYQKDPILFVYKLSDENTKKYYTRGAGGKYRYPKVMTNEEKKMIDAKDKASCLAEDSTKCSKLEQEKCKEDIKNCKSSYQTQTSFENNNKKFVETDEYLECSNSTKGLTDKSKCNSINYGSGSEENFHWYTCAKIVELNSNMTLTIDDLNFEEDGFVSKYDADLKAGRKASVVDWRKDLKTGRDILSFKPNYENKNYPVPNGADDSTKATERNSLLFMAKNEESTFPGFYNANHHPLGIAVPICSKTRSKDAAKQFSNDYTETRVVNNYIQTWGNLLSNNRLGLLPPTIAKSLGTVCKSGDRSLITGECYLREGVSENINSVDNFFELLLKYKSVMKDGIKTVKDIKQHILLNLGERDFKNLNRGNLHINFKNNSVFKSFQNYLEYVISDQPKLIEYFYDLLILSNNRIFKDDNFKLIILDYKEIGETGKVTLKCCNFTNFEIKNDDIIGVSLLYKNRYEIIGKYNSLVSSNTFNVNSLDENGYLKTIVTEFNKRCTIEVPSDIIYQSKNLNYNIIKHKTDLKIIETKAVVNNASQKIYLEDIYSKIIGILITKDDNNKQYYIPVYPQLKEGIFEKLSIYNYYDTIMTDNLPTKTEYISELTAVDPDIVPIQKVVINQEFKGYVLNSGHYVRLANDNFDDSQLDEINVEPSVIDKEIYNSNIDVAKNNFKKALSYEYVLEIIGNPSKDEYEDVLNQDEIVAIKYKNIFIPVKNHVNELPDDIEIEFKKYILDAQEISQKYNYSLNCLPVRGILEVIMHTSDIESNPKYTHLILETGLKIKLKKPFNISNRDILTGQYKIKNLINLPIVDQVFGNFIPDYKKIIQSERALRSEQIMYKAKIMDILRMELYLMLQKPEFNSMKTLLKSILISKSITSSSKETILFPVLDRIINLVIEVDNDISISDIDTLLTCNNNLVDNKICTEMDDISIKNIDKESYKKLILSEAEIEKGSRFNKFENEFIDKIVQNYNDLAEKNIQLRKIRINDLDNELIKQLKNNVINDIIHNIYIRTQLFEKYTNNTLSNKYKIHEPDEYMVSHYDYNLSLLDAIFKKKKQMYYNEIVPFDLVDFTLSSENISFKGKCMKSSKSESVLYKTSPVALKKINVNPDKTNVISLTEDHLSKIYQVIFSSKFYPDIFTRCERKDSEKITYTITQ